MSFNEEEAVEEVGLDPDDSKATDIYVDMPCSLKDLDLDPYIGSSQSSLSEDEVETEDNSEFDSGSKLQMLFQHHGVQSVSSASDKGDLIDCLPLVNDKIKEMVQQPTDRMSQGARGHSFLKSYITQQSAPWADAEADHSRKGRLGKRLVDLKRASMAPLHHKGLKGGRACRTKKKKKSTKSKKTVPEDIPDPSPDLAPDPDPDSASDEDKEMQVMRVTICFKNGEQIISGNAMDPGDKNKKKDVQPRVNFHHMTLQMPAPRDHMLGTGKLGASCSNRKATVFRGKEQSRPRYPGAAAGGVCKVSSKKKLAQEKKPLQDAPRFTGRRPVPLWGQRPKAAPVETSTFPPITSIPTLESSKKYSTASLEVIEPAHGTSRKRAVARNTRGGLPVARGDRGFVCKDTMKNLTAMTPTPESYKIKEIPQAQSPPQHVLSEKFLCELPTHRAEQPCTCMYRGEMTSGDLNFRAPLVPGNSQLLALSHRGTSPRAPAPNGDQDPSMVPLLPAGEKHHQSPGTLGCQQCPLLEKEAHKLRKQLAIMRALNKKFQDL